MTLGRACQDADPMLIFTRLRAGHAIALRNRGGKSELQTGGMPGNARSR